MKAIRSDAGRIQASLAMPLMRWYHSGVITTVTPTRS
jgi:hypothetical protein